MIRGGRPKIAGTGLTVGRIVSWYKMGLTPEEIALEYPHLTLAQVHGALAYYHANREEIEVELAQEELTSATSAPFPHLKFCRTVLTAWAPLRRAEPTAHGRSANPD